MTRFVCKRCACGSAYSEEHNQSADEREAVFNLSAGHGLISLKLVMQLPAACIEYLRMQCTYCTSRANLGKAYKTMA
jgi:hypothetical protein